jgi:hypothetical protein
MIKISDHLIFVLNERRELYHFSSKHTFKVHDFAYTYECLLKRNF